MKFVKFIFLPFLFFYHQTFPFEQTGYSKPKNKTFYLSNKLSNTVINGKNSYFSKNEFVEKKLELNINMPRFLRQGDHVELTSNVVNLTQTEITGQIQLQLFDAANNQVVDGWFINTFPNQYFTVAPGQSAPINFPIQVPFQFNSVLSWKITATAGVTAVQDVSLTHQKEGVLLVLSNQLLVTEALPLPLINNGTKMIPFRKFQSSATNETVQQHLLTVQYTANPQWYTIQALPFLMTYQYENAEQVWNHYFAAAVARKLMSTIPVIKQLFEQWNSLDSSTLHLNLQHNGLPTSLLFETSPWVLGGMLELKKNLSLLLNQEQLQDVLTKNLDDLKSMIRPDGSFPWFRGGPQDRYMTQYIATSIGQLIKIKSIPKEDETALMRLVEDMFHYLDKKIEEDYQKQMLVKSDLQQVQISLIQVQYLYMRSFFPGHTIPKTFEKAFNFFKVLAKKKWKNQPVMEQGMIALALSRTGDDQTSAQIIRSLKQRSVVSIDGSRFWKDIGLLDKCSWNTTPIETQSLMVETFDEVGKDLTITEELITWLIRNKQTHNWLTTKATASACYALLLLDSDWNATIPPLRVGLGKKFFSPATTDSNSRYFEEEVTAPSITPEMGSISVHFASPTRKFDDSLNLKKSSNFSLGSVYWQYFTDIEELNVSKLPLLVIKKLFIEKKINNHLVLIPILPGTELHVGDTIKVRIELRAEKDVAHVLLKDNRASTFEIQKVERGYTWSGDLGYYQDINHISNLYFFDILKKGNYLFEYALTAAHTGVFNDGVTSVHCMYAPAYSAHSNGIRILVASK